jgi:glycosyltransferase involved in cell wall biosynthesis
MTGVPGVELAGYLRSAVGVGEAARRYVMALRGVGVPVVERDVPLPGRDPVPESAPSTGRGPVSPGVPASPSNQPADAVRFNLLCLNPEQMVPYLAGPDAPSRENRLTIGVWTWEVDVLPPGWREACEGLTEVWTNSRFAAELLGAQLPVPVLSFPPPLAPPTKADSVSGHASAASAPELPAGFRVLVMFDYLSTLERKNPIGAIEAYRRAFAPTDGAVLVLKSVNGQHRPDQQAEVMVAAAGRPDIVTVDRTISGAERDALIGACDCLLSLHRSEGHGMPLAEAMVLGNPVIATAYGGNIEFMNESNSYLVGWTPVRVGEGVEHYPAGATWAEPDVEHAARLLRVIKNDPHDARETVQRGSAEVEALLSAPAVGASMRSRLEALGANSMHRAFGAPVRGVRKLIGGLRAGERS